MDHLKSELSNAQNGDTLARERLIRHYKPYILNTVGHICRRFINWSEEESSIGLLALNKAIDTFDETKGRTFLNYVYLITKRDLIDFFRKEDKERHLSMNHTELNGTQKQLDVERSLEQYSISQHQNNLVEEILELSNKLLHYDIKFEQLEKYSPKHSDTRETLFTLVDQIKDVEEIVSSFLQKKKLPVSLIVEKTNATVKTLERHRKYIVTLLLLQINPQWVLLRQYLQKGGKQNG